MLKYKIVGYQFVNYQKDGKEYSGYRFHLLSEQTNSERSLGSQVDLVYISSSQQELINQLLDLYKSQKYFRLYYNKFQRVEGVLI